MSVKSRCEDGKINYNKLKSWKDGDNNQSLTGYIITGYILRSLNVTATRTINDSEVGGREGGCHESRELQLYIVGVSQ